MRNLIILLIIIYSTSLVAQPYTHEMHSDSLFRINLKTGDSVFLPSQPQAYKMIRDSSKNAVTMSNIQTALGYLPVQLNRYAINVQALTSSPVDAQTIFFGTLPKAPVTVAGTSKVYIRRAGTIKVAEIYCYSGTAGSNEAWPMYIRLNNTTDYLIASLSLATSERIFTNTGLSIPVVIGDYFEIKSIYPTWLTNPLTTILGGYIILE